MDMIKDAIKDLWTNHRKKVDWCRCCTCYFNNRSTI